MPEGSPSTPTVSPTPPVAPVLDPEAQAAVKNEELTVLIRDLNVVREALSKMMADDFKANSGATPFQRSPMSVEQLDRNVESNKLHEREHGLMTQIREMRGEGIGY